MSEQVGNTVTMHYFSCMPISDQRLDSETAGKGRGFGAQVKVSFGLPESHTGIPRFDFRLSAPTSTSREAAADGSRL